MKTYLKIYLVSSVLIMMLISFNGCFPNGKGINPNIADVSSSNNLETPQDIPSHIKENLLDNVSIDADVCCPKNVQWKTYEVTLKNFADSNELRKSFLKDKTIQEENRYESGSTIENSVSYNLTDGSGVTCGAGKVGYITPSYSNRFYRQMIEAKETGTYIRSDIGDIYTKANIEEINRDTAINLVKEKALALGLTISNTPEVYALDYDTFKNYWGDFFLKDGTEAKPWGKEDEAYLIRFRGEIDNIPISDKSYINAENGACVFSQRIYAIVSKEGLIYFNCEGIYDISASLDNVNLISLDTAKESIKTKYSNIITTNPILISSISAELVPHCTSVEPLKFELIPVWTFIINQKQTYSDIKGETTIDTSFPVFINGITGEELRTGGVL